MKKTKKELRELVVAFFKQNAALINVFATTDGYMFGLKNDAQNHLKALNKDNANAHEIFEFDRESFNKEASTEPEKKEPLIPNPQ